jgi:hypothetical protein
MLTNFNQVYEDVYRTLAESEKVDYDPVFEDDFMRYCSRLEEEVDAIKLNADLESFWAAHNRILFESRVLNSLVSGLQVGVADEFCSEAARRVIDVVQSKLFDLRGNKYSRLNVVDRE